MASITGSYYGVVNCISINALNSVVRASVVYPMHPGIEMAVSFNLLLAHEVIDTKVMQLIKATNASLE